MHDKEHITAMAKAVAEQLADTPLFLGIPVDPELADFMGAFSEDAIDLADVIEDGLLTVNGQGEVVYEGR